MTVGDEGVGVGEEDGLPPSREQEGMGNHEGLPLRGRMSELGRHPHLNLPPLRGKGEEGRDCPGPARFFVAEPPQNDMMEVGGLGMMCGDR